MRGNDDDKGGSLLDFPDDGWQIKMAQVWRESALWRDLSICHVAVDQFAVSTRINSWSWRILLHIMNVNRVPRTQVCTEGNDKELRLIVEGAPKHPPSKSYGESPEEYARKNELRKSFKGLPVSDKPYAISCGVLRDNEMKGFCSAGLYV